MEPIMNVNTYIAIKQWGSLITGISVLVIFAIFFVRFVPVLIKNWIDDYKRHKKWKENIENSPNVFEEFTKKPKTEKEQL
jgi:hypothetical protein